MSTLSVVRPGIKPSRFAKAPSGRFINPMSPASIFKVELPNAFVAWQVGPYGRIYAERRHAVAFAARRQGRAVAR